MTTVENQPRTARNFDLAFWFRAQDHVVVANRAIVEQEFDWISNSIGLISDIQYFLGGEPALSLRKKQKQPQREAANIVINLLNDALGGLVNSSRLLLFGAHAEAFTVLRSAFEACCYAEFFAANPNRVSSYLQLESVLAKDNDLNPGRTLRQHGIDFGQVRTYLESLDSQDRSTFYARLCNFGSHPSPLRVGLRLSANEGLVLAPVSKDRTTWMRNGAWAIMPVAKYALGMGFEYYSTWLSLDSSLRNRYQELLDRYRAMESGS